MKKENELVLSGYVICFFKNNLSEISKKQPEFFKKRFAGQQRRQAVCGLTRDVHVY